MHLPRDFRKAHGGADRPTGDEGHAQQAKGAEQIRTQQCRLLSNKRSPIVADDDGMILPEGVDQPDDVADQIEDVIGGNPAGLSV